MMNRMFLLLFCSYFLCALIEGYQIKEYKPDENKTADKYFLSQTEVTYYDALQICQEQNMQLLSIQTNTKNKEIFNLLNGTTGAYWTSGNKITQQDDTWRWLKGEIMEYYNWRENEPNNKRSDENCLEVFRSSNEVLWNDQPCTDKRPFICENLSAEVLSPNCLVHNKEFNEANTIPEEGYFIGRNIVTYSKAVQLCKAMCMSLVSIEDERKNQDLYDAFVRENATEIFWSSGHFKPQNRWQWINGENVKFSSWNIGEPNNARQNEFCVEILQRDGKIVWNDQPCEDKRMYVCDSIGHGQKI